MSSSLNMDWKEFLKKDKRDMKPYDFWNAIGNPRHVLGPMVDQSELAYRKLVSNYNCDLYYTPMIHSVLFTTEKHYYEKFIKDIDENHQPTFAQFCGHDPDILLKAGRLVEDKVPAIDLNLGCPQAIAKRGFYGSYLLEDTDLVLKIAGYLSNNLKCGFTCKIRLFPDLEKTFCLVKQLEERGIKVLTVHGRTKEENKHLVGQCNWDAIRKIKQLVNIPVIANGGLEEYEDIEKCFNHTGCDAIMSAEKILENPFIFTGKDYNIDDIALEYLNLSRETDNDISYVRSHLFKFYYHACKLDMSYNQRLCEIQTLDEFYQIGEEIKEFRKNIPNSEKFGWYQRYRNQPRNGLTFKINAEYEENFSDLFAN